MSIQDQLAQIMIMTSPELVSTYVQLHGRFPRSRHVQWLRKRIAHRLQEDAFGGLSSVAKRRLRALVDEIDPTIIEPPKPRPTTTSDSKPLVPGTTLVKQWHGRRYEVLVREDGFELDGEHYKSLSAVASAIAGTRWNGWRFFGLRRPPRELR